MKRFSKRIQEVISPIVHGRNFIVQLEQTFPQNYIIG